MFKFNEASSTVINRMIISYLANAVMQFMRHDSFQRELVQEKYREQFEVAPGLLCTDEDACWNIAVEFFKYEQEFIETVMNDGRDIVFDYTHYGDIDFKEGSTL